MARRSWLDSRIRRTVAVHTTNGQSITGILVTVAGDVVVLRHASILAPNDSRPALDGDVAIPKARVAFVQVVDDGGPR